LPSMQKVLSFNPSTLPKKERQAENSVTQRKQQRQVREKSSQELVKPTLNCSFGVLRPNIKIMQH
jgi:hypothetical protein